MQNPFQTQAATSPKNTSAALFEPYVFTPMDHALGRIQFATFLTFHVPNPSSVIPILEAGVTRLISQLPFLSGNITPSNRFPGKQNVLEMQPPTDECLLRHPMFRVKFHPQSIHMRDGSSTVSYDDLLDEFVPTPPSPAEADACPALRLQANVMHDGIILCFYFHHVALDGMGLYTVMEALAACCRSGSEPIRLRSSPEKQQKDRQRILEASAFSNASRLFIPPTAPDWTGLPSWVSEPPVSRKLVLDGEKIAELKKACATALEGRSGIQAARISSNTIITAVIWLCYLRTQHRQLAMRQEPVPAESTAVTIFELRSRLQPRLDASYMGNAIVTREIHAPIEPLLSSSGPSSCDRCTTAAIDPHEIYILADLATRIHAVSGSVIDQRVREDMSAFAAKDDWSTTIALGDITFSSLRSFKYYELDFGPDLGRVEDFDLPENRCHALVWILPARYKDRISPWEVRLSLEPTFMERFRMEGLMTWLEGKEICKLP